MSFDKDKFFEDTILPTINGQPDYARETTLPIGVDTLPAANFDEVDDFRLEPCRLGYWPVSKFTKIGLVTLDEVIELPRAVAIPTFALPDNSPFDGIVVGKKWFHTVSGLRDASTGMWHRVRGDQITNFNLIDIVEAMTLDVKYRAKKLPLIDGEKIHTLRQQHAIEYASQITRSSTLIP
jgi:hypothetical protein